MSKGIQVIADYHTHTIYSHGKGTIEENVIAALGKGLHKVGITDHGPGHLFIGIKGVSAFRQMQLEIKKLREKYPQIEILLGVEANIVDSDGTIDVSTEILRELDLLLLGYHKLVKPRSLLAASHGVRNFISGWTGRSSAKLRRQNTAAVTAAVRRYPVYAITHPGLHIDINTEELAYVCKENGTMLEINSSYGKKLDPYIKAALPSGVNFVVNSDAHTPQRVGDFSEAYNLVQRLEVPHSRIANAVY